VGNITWGFNLMDKYELEECSDFRIFAPQFTMFIEIANHKSKYGYAKALPVEWG